MALGIDKVDARGALRFSFDESLTQNDIARIVYALPEIVDRARLANV